jgi:hypothetical protein
VETNVKAFLDRAPTIQIKEGVVHVLDNSGGATIDRAMSIKSLEDYVARGRRALDRFVRGDTDIIEGG